MKRRLPTHAERVRHRHQVNGGAYADNPLRLPSDNASTLIVPLHLHNRIGLQSN